MRKGLFLCLTLVLVFALASCSIPLISDSADETEPPAHTFVITTQGLTGLFKMADCVSWDEDSVCSLQYLGDRDSYKEKLNNILKKRFSSVEPAALDTMKTVDMGGDDVYLVVPRFDQIAVCAFGIQYLSAEEKPRLLKQYTDQTMPFVMICNAQEEEMNCQIVIYIESTGQVLKHIPQRSLPVSEYPLGFQPIEKG